MKKHVLAAVLSAATVLASAQTATNFNCTDCSGGSHDLFAELNAGKVIVLVWVMPCGACTGAALTTYNVVESYASSNPDRVYMYLCDDYANTSCTSLNSWKTSNGLVNAVTFSNAAIAMHDYGNTGMPKVVVLGGGDHTVFYNTNYTVNATSLQTGIDAALLATGIKEQSALATELNVYPDPANDKAHVTFTLARSSDVTLGLYDLSGKLVKNIHGGVLSQGDHSMELVTGSIPAATYVLKLSDGTRNAFFDLIISH